MIIEALDAANGDATLIRHTGPRGPVVGLVDGGPPSTWRRALEPALAGHGITTTAGELDWLMVSHVDDDHIGGVLALVRAGVVVGRFFFNTPSPFPSTGVVVASGPAGGADRETRVRELLRSVAPEVVTASIRQGQDLLDEVLRSSADLNPPRNERLLTGDSFGIDGLSVGVVAPSRARVDKLLAKWADVVATPASAERMDTSVTNLSSLAVLVREGSQTALFTGDGLEDDIVAGLEQLGHALPMHVDVLKLPHHGSNSAANPASVAAGRGLLENVTAGHYIVSANGASTNPSSATLERIVAAAERRPGAETSIVLPAPRSAGSSKRARHYAAALDEVERLRAASTASIKVVVGTGGPVVIDLSSRAGRTPPSRPRPEGGLSSRRSPGCGST